jgi:hypothetical protein
MIAMNAILKYHLRQLLNYWHHLKFRIRVEILILFIIFYSFFTDKLVYIFNSVLNQPSSSSIGLSTLVLNIFLLAIFMTTPFIYFNLFPKQIGLSILSLYPLKRSEAKILQIIYFTKYQLVFVLIALPVFTALTLTLGPLILIYILFMISVALTLSSMLIQILAVIYQNRPNILFRYYFYLFLYILIFAALYWATDIFLYGTIFILSVGWIILARFWNKHWKTWDQTLNRYRPAAQKSGQALSKLTYFSFPGLFINSFRPFLIKEFLSHIRNKNYMRLKIISLVLYISVLILIEIFYFDHFSSAISILTILLIWEHYSHQFNEKYVLKESPVFLKALPVSYIQYSVSKFLSEFLYIVLILMIIFLLAVIHQIEWIKILNILGIVTLFSVFVLYIITMVRVLFYDNPRLAGYAYHFLIIFTFVMIYNFYLVGPIITLFIILYVQYLSYRQFSR